MKITKEIETPSIVIAHFLNEEAVLERGGRLIHYQVTVYPSTDAPLPYKATVVLDNETREIQSHGRSQLSPNGDYIRFGDVRGDEITGWQPCSNIVIDEILFEYASMDAIPFVNEFTVEGKEPEAEQQVALAG